MATSERNNQDSRQERTPKSSSRRARRRLPAPARIVLTVFLRLFQVLGTLLLIFVVTGCFVACYGAHYIQTVIIPEAGLNLDQFTLNESSVLCYYDPDTGDAVEMRTLWGSEDREWVDYEDIPKHFINAAVAIEDRDFWTHQGVDWWRTAGAVYYMFTGQDVQGGSTITQQLIKNLTQENDVTVKRKIGEIFNALETEKDYEKEEIITWYLNYIFLGSGKYGIATAAQYYFGKELSEITLAEAASIIAITNNPSIYSPASTVTIETSKGVPWQGRQWNKYRQELILAQMLDQGMISQAEHDAAVAQELDFAFDDGGEDEDSEIFTWYEEAAINEVVDYLTEEHGLSSRFAYDIVYGGGLVIYTAFDPNVQACVDEIYSSVENLPYIARDGQQMQSAITIVDNSNGYVVAMAGKIGEKKGNLDMNYATDGVRQPGSSFKPLSAYSPAIEMGLITPATVVDDSPYMLNDGNPWPRNDNRLYRGLVSVKTGITRSLNTIATKLVGDYVTVEASYQFLTELYGFTTLVERMEDDGRIKTDIDVAPLAMGGLTRGVTTFEMAAAFAAFPRAGEYTEPVTVLRVETKDGQLVWDNEPDSEYIIKKETAWYMNDILYSAANYGTGGDALVDGQNVAGKTGTTSDNYDRWFAGYTPYYTGVVWTGYPYNASMSGTDGNPAAVLWRQVMTLVHEGLEKKSFFTLDNTTTLSICLDCGAIATEACINDIRTVIFNTSRVSTFTFAPGDAPTSYCTCHIPITICVDDPERVEGGGYTGAFHLAGDYCPPLSVYTVYIVAYDRSEVGASVTVGDAAYHTSYYEANGIGQCTLHTKPDEPAPDPGTDDPSVVDPGVSDPTGPETGQPGTGEPGTGEPGTGDDPGGGEGGLGGIGEGTTLPGTGTDWGDFDWSSFDPYDWSTWPFDPYTDPSTWPFDPYDPTTWPIIEGGTGAPSPSPDPGGTGSTGDSGGTSGTGDTGSTGDTGTSGDTGSTGEGDTPPPDEDYVPAGSG